MSKECEVTAAGKEKSLVASHTWVVSGLLSIPALSLYFKNTKYWFSTYTRVLSSD